MTKTVYAVMEQEFNYNDETYHYEGVCGTPLRAYKDKKKADKECAVLTNKYWRNHNFGEYCYDGSDIFEGDWPSLLPEGKASADNLYYVDWKALPEEDMDALIELCTLEPFYVQRLEIDD